MTFPKRVLLIVLGMIFISSAFFVQALNSPVFNGVFAVNDTGVCATSRVTFSVGMTGDTIDLITALGDYDNYAFVATDANGVSLGAARGSILVGLTSNLLVGVDLAGINPITARPVRVRLYDVVAQPVGAFNTQQLYDSILAQGAPLFYAFTFDPADYVPSCAALPLASFSSAGGNEASPAAPPDDRLNWQHGDLSAVIYTPQGEGIRVYGVDANSSGYLVAALDDTEIPDCTPHTGSHILLYSKAGLFSAWRLNTCEFQVNIGPDAEGKVFVTRWRGIPADRSTIEYETLNG
ncbi:MAG: hypothetical protein H6672_05800 [Anaerolineaceae bacterium]|nr:hypothetical protein [Anaerolineaceae bacterium]